MSLDQQEHNPIKLAGMCLIVHGYSFPDARSFWDANTLSVEATVVAPGAQVDVEGRLRTTELSAFEEQLSTLYRQLRGTARLKCLEPFLTVEVTCHSLGQLDVVVEATPDHMTQLHRFRFKLDQTILGTRLRALKRVLQRCPVRHESAS